MFVCCILISALKSTYKVFMVLYVVVQVSERTGELEKELAHAQSEADRYLDRYHGLTQRYNQLETNTARLQTLLQQAGMS